MSKEYKKGQVINSCLMEIYTKESMCLENLKEKGSIFGKVITMYMWGNSKMGILKVRVSGKEPREIAMKASSKKV